MQVISNREQFVKMLAGLPDDMEEYMIRQYRNLCMDQLVLKQYAKFIDILFRQEKVLFCGIAELERTVQESGLLFAQSAGGGGRCDI